MKLKRDSKISHRALKRFKYLVGGAVSMGVFSYIKQGSVHNFLENYFVQAEDSTSYMFEGVQYQKRVFTNATNGFVEEYFENADAEECTR
jgi:hypothetical protein